MQPTFKAVIEKPTHLAVDEDSVPEPPPPSPAKVKMEECCPITKERVVGQYVEPHFTELLQALGAAFLVGALTGGVLAYSFSKHTVIVSDFE